MNSELKHTQLDELIGNPPGYDAVTNSFSSSEDLLRHQMEMLICGGGVKRYHTIRTHQHETVAEHSHGVAVLCWITYNEAGVDISPDLLVQALVHDLAEHRVGDIPAPVKRVLGISAAFSEIEDSVLDTAGMWSVHTGVETLVLKFADSMQGLLFCLTEKRMGNAYVDEALHNYEQYVQARLEQLYRVPGTEATRLSVAASRIFNAAMTNERSARNER